MLLGEGLCSEDQGGGPIREGGRVCSGDCAAVRFLHERSFQRCNLVDVHGVVLLVLGDHQGGAFPLGDLHGDDFGLEDGLLLLPCGLCTAVGLEGEPVLVGAGDAELACSVLRAVTHCKLVVDVPEAVPDQAVLGGGVAVRGLRACEVPRDEGHVLHAARDRSGSMPELDVLRRERHGLEPRCAHLVHRRRLRRLRKPREDRRLPRRRLPHPRGKYIPHVHVRDAFGWQRRAREGCLYCMRPQPWRGGVLERPHKLKIGKVVNAMSMARGGASM